MTTLKKKSAQQKLDALKIKKEKLLVAEKELNKLKEEEKTLMEVIANADKQKDITSIANTFKKCCKLDKKNPKTILPYKNPKTDDEIFLNAIMMMTIICRVWAQDWEADYDNGNQKKWFPCFYKVSSGRSSGFVYSHSFFNYVGTYSVLGSRFAFETEGKATSAGNIFIKIWNQILLKQK